MTKLNIGCGDNLITGFVNIDPFQEAEVDLRHNFITDGPYPFEAGSVNEIVMFHTIEHIEKKYHEGLLNEFYRLLKPKGLLIISYPEFERCAQNWIKNHQAMRTFWEATIYGRQLNKGDFHVSLMDSINFKALLTFCGFPDSYITSEPKQLHNSVAFCKKGVKPIKYENLIARDMQELLIEQA